MAISSIRWVRDERPQWQGRTVYEARLDKATTRRLLKRPRLESCDRPCTSTIELLPPTAIQGQTGHGYAMVNVDGYRHLDCYLISDPLTNPTDRGFTLQLSFALGPFQLGLGWLGETWVFSDASQVQAPARREQSLVWLRTSDLAADTGLPPWTGGSNLSTITRVPVMGPYVRAMAFNEDGATRTARVLAYATT